MNEVLDWKKPKCIKTNIPLVIVEIHISITFSPQSYILFPERGGGSSISLREGETDLFGCVFNRAPYNSQTPPLLPRFVYLL